MDFSLNELQTMLADSISRFIDNEYDFDTRQAYADSERGFSDAVWAKFAELGWTAVPFAEEDGGIGGTPVDVMVLMENLARGLVGGGGVARRGGGRLAVLGVDPSDGHCGPAKRCGPRRGPRGAGP